MSKKGLLDGNLFVEEYIDKRSYRIKFVIYFPQPNVELDQWVSFCNWQAFPAQCYLIASSLGIFTIHEEKVVGNKVGPYYQQFF